MEKTKDFLKSEYNYASDAHDVACSDYYHQLGRFEELQDEYKRLEATVADYRKVMIETEIEMNKYAELCKEMGIKIID